MELVDPMEITCNQGELPPIENNLDNEGEDFQFSNEENLDYNVDCNGEGETSSDLEEEEEEGDKDMDDADLDWMSQESLTLPYNLHKMLKHLEFFL